MDRWTFGPAKEGKTVYADGTEVPHRSFQVLLNGVAVGEVDVHMHKRRGRDGVTDVSFGATHVVFGPPQGGS